MLLAVDDVNAAAQDGSLPLRLMFEDTGGTPEAARAAVERLLTAGVTAVIGEFHSVAAAGILDVIERAAVPFVCASATLDDITARRLRHVFRIAPPQAYGWRIYADYLAASGTRDVIALLQPNVYWDRGAHVLATGLAARGVRFARIPVVDAAAIPRATEALASIVAQAERPPVALLLVGYPEPLSALVRSFQDRGLWPPFLTFGDPAGRPIFQDWWDVAGPIASTMPFLAYIRPAALPARGHAFADRSARRHGRAPTFVAFEGYDSVLAVARAADAGPEPPDVTEALRSVRIAGTRGEISFATTDEPVVHQQWSWPPVVVARYDGALAPTGPFTILWDVAM
jgi:ABC-type branched-subunit amino acid transport system substrate-binding protein